MIRVLRISANIGIALVALVLLFAPPKLSAQSDEMYDKTFPFIGHWDPEIDNPNGQDRGNCGGRLGDGGPCFKQRYANRCRDLPVLARWRYRRAAHGLLLAWR